MGRPIEWTKIKTIPITGVFVTESYLSRHGYILSKFYNKILDPIGVWILFDKDQKEIARREREGRDMEAPPTRWCHQIINNK